MLAMISTRQRQPRFRAQMGGPSEKVTVGWWAVISEDLCPAEGKHGGQTKWRQGYAEGSM